MMQVLPLQLEANVDFMPDRDASDVADPDLGAAALEDDATGGGGAGGSGGRGSMEDWSDGDEEDEEEEDVDVLDNEINYKQGNGKGPEWQLRGQGEDIDLSSSSRHEPNHRIPRLTSGQQVNTYHSDTWLFHALMKSEFVSVRIPCSCALML